MLASIRSSEKVVLPPHPDGDKGWAYAIVDDDGNVFVSDDTGELVALTIERYNKVPYTDEGHDEALAMRYEALVQIAERAQHFLVDEAVEKGIVDPVEADEDSLTALFSPRSRPWDGITGPDGEVCHEWWGRAPLVLIATDYAPYTERPCPSGNVVLLDPATETSFLLSLDVLGLVKFLVAG